MMRDPRGFTPNTPQSERLPPRPAIQDPHGWRADRGVRGGDGTPNQGRPDGFTTDGRRSSAQTYRKSLLWLSPSPSRW